MRIGIVGGSGWLGGAIGRALLDRGLVAAPDLYLSYRSRQPEGWEGCIWTRDNQALADRSDIVILSVRPQDWPALQLRAEGKLIISVMAGIRLQQLAEAHQSSRVIRALPNAAAEVRHSYTPWIAAPGAGAGDKEVVRQIFGACGVEDEVGDEAAIDYLTGLTGSGPAFPALLASAMMRHAEAQGLPAAVAQRAVNALFIGAGRLLEARDLHPEATVEIFRAYRGTTAAAIDAMRAAGFDTAVEEGLEAAARTSRSMGE